MLAVAGLDAGYGSVQALHGVSLGVSAGEWVAVVGASGSGKTTLVRAIAGLAQAWHGSMVFEGRELAAVPAHRRTALGIAVMLEGRRLFTGMTVAENLDVGALGERRGERIAERRRFVEELFPILRARAGQVVGTLSGGEQQMCALGRALMSGPRLLVIDELSLGLAPSIVAQALEALHEVNRLGTAILLIDQDFSAALSAASRGYVLRVGRVVMEGEATAILDEPRFQREYLGY